MTKSIFDLDWLITLAREAGEIALGYFRRTASRRKADHTIVTEADLAVESFLTQQLRRRFPDHGILGEEEIAHHRHAAYAWVLDPIDGTAVFAAGLPIWCISIGLLVKGRPAAGVVHLPVTRDVFAVDLEGPPLLNGEPIQVAPNEPYHDETILFGVADAHRLWRIDFPGKMRAFGACAAHFCYVAAGFGVGGLNTHTALWDIAAALPILERAGGACSLLDGSPIPFHQIIDGVKIPQPVVFAPTHFLPDIRSRLTYFGEMKKELDAQK
ncbi:MAG: inositol monophosphatase [Chloroflexi bacterium]|nr:inositol monophosphatase [Chloroflexota bacterium]